MEIIKEISQIKKLSKNEIIGNPQLNNSIIRFKGTGNILYCENNLELTDSLISFDGNNSIIYLSKGKYPINLFVKSDSTIFIGKNNKIISKLIINIQENQNFIMGDDGLISSGVTIRSSDGFPIYDLKTKNKINLNNGIFIGDHVWLDYSSYISGGVKIGSGSIIGNHSFISPNTIIPSNTLVQGNPGRIMMDNVFFTKEYIGNYNLSESNNTMTYKSNIYEYSTIDNETLNLNKINQILTMLSLKERLEFIIKLFVKNKRRNRFTIKPRM